MYPAYKLDLLPAIAELAQLDQWVVSKYIERNGKLDKPPFSPILDSEHKKPWMCSHSDPTHWASYDVAYAALNGFNWLGFVFSKYDPYLGIDVDGCAKPGIERIRTLDDLELWARRIVELTNSYTEISPSGTGVKIFVRGKLAKSFNYSLGAHKGIEIYSKNRYFTVTSQHLSGTPTKINNAQNVIDSIVAQYAPVRPQIEHKPAQHAISVPKPNNGKRASLADVKARFNAEHTLESLLAGYGAVPTKDGYTCPFCTHTHETTLYISKYGRLFSYSPNCKLHTTKGYDAFGLYVLIEHNNDVVAAAKTLNPIGPHQKRQEPPLAEPVPIRTQTPEQAADAQRKRAERRAAAATTIADVQTRANQDTALKPADRAVLEALITTANGRDWCRPSKTRIAEMCGYSLGSVKRSLMVLEQRGYFASEGEGGGSNCTAIRTFLRGSLTIEPTNEVIRESYRANNTNTESKELVSGGEQPQADQSTELREIHSLAEYGQELSIALGGTILSANELADLPLCDLEELVTALEVELSAPANTTTPHQEAPPAGPQAYYDPGAALQLVGEYTGKPKRYADFETRWAWSNAAIVVHADVSNQSEQMQLDSHHAEQEDRQVRSAPIEPSAADRYWKLRGKAKYAKSAAQRSELNRQADELMIWRSASNLQPLQSKRKGSVTAPPHKLIGNQSKQSSLFQQGV